MHAAALLGSVVALCPSQRTQIYWRHVDKLVFADKQITNQHRLRQFAAIQLACELSRAEAHPATATHELSRAEAHPATASGQECDVPFPGLRAKPWWQERDQFSWIADLESRAHVVADELERLQARQSKTASGSVDTWENSVTTLCQDTSGFSKLILSQEGEPTDAGKRDFPKTLELLRAARVPLTPRPVALNRQGPLTGLAPHSDNLNCLLVCHLGVQVPAGVCTFRMHATADDRDEVTSVRSWEEGKVLVADTSFVHSTRNDSPTESRFVLHLSIWHPDLTRAEIDGIGRLHTALRVYEAEVARLEAPGARDGELGCQALEERSAEPPSLK